MPAPRILVVEDERIIALNLRQQLTKLGYDVPNIVTSGDHALLRIEESRPDVVLMDIHLKGKMDGITAASLIPPAYRIPVIYLTVNSEDATLARAGTTNPYGYILKPFTERELHATILMALARRRTEHATRAGLECRQRARRMTALGLLAGGIAEEFDDLLAVIYSQLEVLGNHAIADLTLAGPIREAYSEAMEKEQLIGRLLAFSGRQRLTSATVSADDVVANVTKEFRDSDDSIQIRTHLPDGLWMVRIDADQLARALSNIVTNAVEAMPDGGSLTIEAQNTTLDQDNMDGLANMAAGRYVQLSMADTGPGMAEHVVARAFEPFFTTKPAAGGNGLGLSLVFGFVRQSGGHISLDSKPGSGTTVRIYLPAALENGAPIPSPFPVVVEDGAAQEGAAQEGLAPGETAIGSRATSSIWKQYSGNRSPRERSSTAQPDGELPVLWHRVENSLFASVRFPLGQTDYRLIVEPLPRGNGWDWAVWRPGGTGQTSRHGRASSVTSAMAAAGDAARHWDGTE